MEEANFRFCSTSRIVKPSALSRRMVAPICWTMTGASPSVGSSRSSSRAPVRRIRPMASICCSPPESLVPWLRSRSRRLGNSSSTSFSLIPPGRTFGGRRRFSSTSRLAKMPRSSGQISIPSRAIRCGARRMVSVPSSTTEPSRRGTIPINERSVVVFPAPLRPSRVTSSPGRISKLTPWRMCDSPYQAWSLSTWSIGRAAGSGGGPERATAASDMLRPHVRLHHVLVLAHRRVVALGEDLAPGEHGDVVREVRHHLQVVLDHQHRALGRDALDEGGDPVHVLVPHSRGGLVEEEQLGVQRERGGDLQRSLPA